MNPVLARLGLALGTSFALGGCAVVSQTSFNPAENQHIRSVAFVSIPTPPAPTIRNFGSPAALAGGVGAGIALASSESRNKEPLQQLLAKHRFDFGKEMQQAIATRLQKMGYKVSFVPVQRENPYALLGDYAKVAAAGADAILDSTNGVYFGYSNVSITDRKFRPHLHLYVRLLDANTKKVLYADEIIYGYTNPFMKAAKLPAPDKYFYESDEAVLAGDRRTVEGLRIGIEQIADYIAEQLRGGAAPK